MRELRVNERIKVVNEMYDLLGLDKNKIIQFKYGDDNIDPTKVESQQLPLASATREDIYAHFQIPMDETNNAIITTNYTKPALKRMKKQTQELISKTNEMITYMLESRDSIVEHVFKYVDSTGIHIPVHFRRIINNIHK